MKNYASNKAKCQGCANGKEQVPGQLARNPINQIPPFSYERELQGRIKTELDSAAWGMKQHSWNELRRRNESAPALFESHQGARPSALNCLHYWSSQICRRGHVDYSLPQTFFYSLEGK